MASILNTTTNIMRRVMNISGIIILTILVSHAGAAWALQDCNRKFHEGAGHHAAVQATGSQTLESRGEFVDAENHPQSRLHCLDVSVTRLLAVEMSKTSSLKAPRWQSLPVSASRVAMPASTLDSRFRFSEAHPPNPIARPRHLLLSVLIN